jgi:hypothetical protein
MAITILVLDNTWILMFRWLVPAILIPGPRLCLWLCKYACSCLVTRHVSYIKIDKAVVHCPLGRVFIAEHAGCVNPILMLWGKQGRMNAGIMALSWLRKQTDPGTSYAYRLFDLLHCLYMLTPRAMVSSNTRASCCIRVLWVHSSALHWHVICWRGDVFNFYTF